MMREQNGHHVNVVTVPVSKDIVEVECTLLLRRHALGHQVEDVEALLVRGQVDQTRLLQHEGVDTC